MGPNAGPSKLLRARTMDVVLMDADQFQRMIETGELPTQGVGPK